MWWRTTTFVAPSYLFSSQERSGSAGDQKKLGEASSKSSYFLVRHEEENNGYVTLAGPVGIVQGKGHDGVCLRE